MIATYEGDGTYPVYVRYKHGRPASILIEFDGGAEDEDVEADIDQLIASFEEAVKEVSWKGSKPEPHEIDGVFLE